MVEGYVDAIEEGRIVRVTERYAKMEGLTILSRPLDSQSQEGNAGGAGGYTGSSRFKKKQSLLNFDKYRKPLDYRKNNVIAELMENFHWELGKLRKARCMTRKQLAGALNVSEEDIKSVENGILPADDFVLVSKIEKFYGISLRRGAQPPARPELKGVPKEALESKEDLELPDIDSPFTGNEIEIEEEK